MESVKGVQNLEGMCDEEEAVDVLQNQHQP